MFGCLAEYKYPNGDKVYRIRDLSNTGDVFEGEKIVDRKDMVDLIANGLVVNANTYVRGNSICVRLDKSVPKYKASKEIKYNNLSQGFYYRVKEAILKKIKGSFVILTTDINGLMKQIGLEKYINSKYIHEINFNELIADIAGSRNKCYVAGIHAIENITNEVRILTGNKLVAENFLNEFSKRLAIKYFNNKAISMKMGLSNFKEVIKSNSYLQFVGAE